MSIQVKHVIIIIINVIMSKVECIPVRPCPATNFDYEFNGQEWIGVVKIHPQIYNRLRTDRITTYLTLVTNRYIANQEGLNWLKLKKSAPKTYQDIAKRRPIQYRIKFPFRISNDFPEVLKIQVNGFKICQNDQTLLGISQIKLKYTFFLPTVKSEPSFQINGNFPDPAYTNSMIEVPSVLTQPIDEEDDQKEAFTRAKNMNTQILANQSRDNGFEM